MKTNKFDIFSTIVLLCVIGIIISNPQIFTRATTSGLKLFVTNVLPGLFPFMLITKIITELGVVFLLSKKLDKISYKIFKTKGVSLYVFLMSILSGYPIGAKLIGDLFEKKLIDEKDAKIMSTFCTTSGPMFVVGTVGQIMFNNIKIGFIIYISHILSCFIFGVIYANIINYKQSFNKNNYNLQFLKNENIIQKSISDTVNSIFIVGAYITIFYLINELLGYLKITYILTNIISKPMVFLGINFKQTKSTILGIFEVTRGLKELSILEINSNTICLSTMLVTFSGISIIFQSMNFLNKAKIKTHFFIFVKSVQSIISFFVCKLLLTIL